MRAAYPCPEWLSETILRQSAESGDPEATAIAHSIALSTLQRLCGESEAGHRYERVDNGCEGAYRSAWQGCVVCHAPDGLQWGEL